MPSAVIGNQLNQAPTQRRHACVDVLLRCSMKNGGNREGLEGII